MRLRSLSSPAALFALFALLSAFAGAFAGQPLVDVQPQPVDRAHGADHQLEGYRGRRADCRERIPASDIKCCYKSGNAWVCR